MRLRTLFSGALLLLGAFVSRAGAEPSPRDFYEAIRQNKLADLQKQLDSGAPVDLRDTRGTTPLMHAAAIGSIEAMRLLLKAGADVNAKNGMDATALLWCAANPERAKLLIEAGANVNARSKMGRTPLMMAAAHAGSAATVKLLLDKGADTTPAEVRGNTALLDAARVNDLPSFRLLIEKKVDLDAGDGLSITALGYAASHSNVEMVRALVANGAGLNVAHKRGLKVKNGTIGLSELSSLMIAAGRGNAETVKMLLAAGADWKQRDVRGMTPLQFAVARDKADPAMVKLLLDRGSDPNLKMRDGDSAIDWARKFGNPRVLAMVGGAASQKAVEARTAAAVPTQPRQAVERSIALLTSGSREYLRMSGCSGCHHQPLIGMALSAASRHGFSTDATLLRDQRQLIRSELMGNQPAVLEGIFISTDSLVYALLGLGELGAPPDAATDAVVSAVAAMQREDGSYPNIPLNRPPIEDSRFVVAALANRAMQRYMIPARKEELTGRIAKTRQWLAKAQPDADYERPFQLMGLAWSGADKTTMQRVLSELRKAQRPDGGWAQSSALASDAYATSVALYALRQAGVSAQDAAHRKGVQFLLDRQKPDGSWQVASRSPKFQPYFQSGFPHDHDQWVSAAATAWAVTALAEAVAPGSQSASIRR